MSTAPVIPGEPGAGEPEKKLFKYQPKYPEGFQINGEDVAGQNMGGEQVIEYDGTPEDLGQKMAENTNRLLADLRRWKQRAASMPSEDEGEIPADAARLSHFHAFAPRELTDDEALRISRELADPSKVRGALREAVTAMVGATPDQLRRLDSITTSNYFNAQGAEFRRRHPEIDWRSTERPEPIVEEVQEDGKAVRKTVGMTTGCVAVDMLLAWCRKRDLAYTCENFERACSRLKAAGLLPEAPNATEVIPSEIAAGSEGERPADSGLQPPPSIPRPVVRTSALSTRNSTTPVRQPPAKPIWADLESRTAEQIKLMPAAWKADAYMLVRKKSATELNKLLNNKAWTAKIDALAI